MLAQLLYGQDRNSIEWKALDEASTLLKLSPARLIERCGGLSSSREYHLNRFLFEIQGRQDVVFIGNRNDFLAEPTVRYLRFPVGVEVGAEVCPRLKDSFHVASP